ncbi:hypothetical protein [Chryseolinea sp. H1M3-3]|uniref:hypothetical protein n=1 Tax=Chryseolinea sp. H1M3-3 TaxID=3034144 RepID=UPI0023EB51C5|nr:hypothetical protein [Chryseolinea sp. H1M3-3]
MTNRKTNIILKLFLGSSILILASFQALVNKHEPVILNQTGFEPDAPKRFTAPLTSDGAVFVIRKKNDSKNLFQAKVKNHIGDFTAFNAQGKDFVVVLKGGTETSFPFNIERNFYQEQFWNSALNFMVDSRSVTGSHPSAYGGSPWRDGVYYAYEVPSLIWLYRADPAFFEQMTKQINWEDDKQRILSSGFIFDANNPESDQVMESVKRYYTELAAPHEDAPDIVKLIHWGLGFYLMKPYTKDPSADPAPRQIHSQVVEQFSHLLYAWDRLKLNRWLPQSFYDQCLHFALTHWKASGSFGVDPLWDTKTYTDPDKAAGEWKLDKDLHPYKGRHVPGHSILPNLYMSQVVKDKYPELSATFLAAAQEQTRWIIEHLDWNHPGTTKGQRGSEFQTILNLVWFLEKMPEHAPEGLQQKIEVWAKTVVSRSDNMWDFRRYDLQDHWTIPVMNETGNLAGFPACALAAYRVVKDEHVKARIREVAYAHIDNLFGRNPKMAAASHRPEKGYELVERGWPIGYKLDVCARLEFCRGGLDASPGSEMYPYNPDGKYRHPEGWINWNASWNVSLAMLKQYRENEFFSKY